ncbi:PREDICTED: Werner syndrome ATP-dependent helicase-like, partial [Acropora digitifera]|uniref:Werner syndrome ATP-dependent helicase-like n=1 Tax=Acropora digitifera TaxID=70779 RepID=UPI00077B261B
CIISQTETTDVKPDSEHIEVLKKYFGHAKFRPMQWKIINEVLNNKQDICVVMATGYGKSLCYQFPSLYTGGTTAVISPLISLMEDQVAKLKDLNFQPSSFSGSMALSGSVVLVTESEISTTAHAIQQLFLCIDVQFHGCCFVTRSCIFILSKVPIVALTATATPAVRKDICRSLKLRNARYVCTGFDRPNLYFEVSRKSGSVKEDFKPLLLRSGDRTKIEYSFDGPTIVYCPTKKATEAVTRELQGLGVNCDYYHAGLGIKERKIVHQLFIRDEIQVIFASFFFSFFFCSCLSALLIETVFTSFVSFDLPYPSLPSTCHVFYSTADFVLNRRLLNDISTPSFKQHKLKMLNILEQYLTSTDCRRRTILAYFEDELDGSIGGRDDCCDNCRNRALNPHVKDDKRDFTKEAKLLLGAVMSTGNGRFGITVPILLLKGSNSSKVPNRLTKNKEFGAGNFHTDKWWKSFGRQLMNLGFLQENANPGGFGSLTAVSGKIFIKGSLYTTLLKLRTELSHSLDCPPYMIATNKILLDIAKHRPSSIDSLLKVDGVSERQCERFGQKLVNCVGTFCKDHSLEADNFEDFTDSASSTASQTNLAEPGGTFRRELSQTVITTYNLFHEKQMSIKEVAKARNLVEGTIFGHLADALKAGYAVDYKRAGLTEEIRELVTKTIRSPPINSDISKLSVIKDRLPDYVTYGHIKLVITILELSCQTASCSTAVTPQRKGSFSSSGPPAKAPSNSRSSSQDTARKLPVWLSGKPGGKRKNPF